MTKRQGQRPGGLRLVLVPNHDERFTSLSGDRAFWEGSFDFNQAEAAMRAEMAQSWGLLAAIRLEQANLLPHHLLHDQTGESATVARSIADRAREYPAEGLQSVIGPRAKPKRAKTRLRSEGLLPRTNGPVPPQSGIVTRRIARETWSAFVDFLNRLETTDTVGVLVGDPGLIRQLTEELTRSLDLLKTPTMQDPSFSSFVLPADSGRLLRKQARERLRLAAQGRA